MCARHAVPSIRCIRKKKIYSRRNRVPKYFEQKEEDRANWKRGPYGRHSAEIVGAAQSFFRPRVFLRAIATCATADFKIRFVTSSDSLSRMHSANLASLNELGLDRISAA
jgi:hypothetical protein